MKHHLITTILVIIFSICLVNALSPSTPLVCGTDESGEIIISCLGNEELTFFGLDLPEEVGGFGSDEGPDETHTLPTPIPRIEVEPFLLFGIIPMPFLNYIGLNKEDWLLIYGLLVISGGFLFLWLRKRKCEECKKKFKRKDLTQYKGKSYCEKCLKKLEK